MTGLLLKDIYNLKQTLAIYLCIIIGGICFGPILSATSADFVMSLGGYVIMIGAIATVLTPIQAMGEDEKNKWDQYAVILPVSRREIVCSKYVLMLLCVFVSSAIMVIGRVVLPSFRMSSSMEFIWIMILGAIAYSSIILPINIKFGTQKGRVATILAFYVPAGIVMGLESAGIKLPDVSNWMNYLPVISIGVVMILIVSMCISTKIYEKKEF